MNGQWLLDTNVLLRLQEDDPACSNETTEAVANLLDSAPRVCITPQVLIELWCVGTRPLDANGLGWDVETADARIFDCWNRFEVLDDSPEVFKHWLSLVRTHQTKGKQVHDARLIAVMLAHGVDHLLTFNVDDFRRYQEIKAVHPADVK